eukprot:SAG22_NODE_206_length_15281_cov_6.078975_5_plen_276_part_00
MRPGRQLLCCHRGGIAGVRAAAPAVEELAVAAGPTAVVLPPGRYCWGEGGGAGGGGGGDQRAAAAELTTCAGGASWLRLRGAAGQRHLRPHTADDEDGGGQRAHLLLSPGGSMGLIDGAGEKHTLAVSPGVGIGQRLAWAAAWLSGGSAAPPEGTTTTTLDRSKCAAAATGPNAQLSDDLIELVGLRLAASGAAARGKAAAASLLWRVWREASWWPALRSLLGRQREHVVSVLGRAQAAGRQEAWRRMLAGDASRASSHRAPGNRLQRERAAALR